MSASTRELSCDRDVIRRRAGPELDSIWPSARLLQLAFADWSKRPALAFSLEDRSEPSLLTMYRAIRGAASSPRRRRRGKRVDLLVSPGPDSTTRPLPLDAAIFATVSSSCWCLPDHAPSTVCGHMSSPGRRATRRTRRRPPLAVAKRAARISLLLHCPGMRRSAGAAGPRPSSPRTASRPRRSPSRRSPRLDESVGAALPPTACSLGADTLSLAPIAGTFLRMGARAASAPRAASAVIPPSGLH